MKYTNAYCNRNKLYILGDRNQVLNIVSIPSNYTVIGPATFEPDCITVLAEYGSHPGMSNTVKLLEYTHSGCLKNIITVG